MAELIGSHIGGGIIDLGLNINPDARRKILEAAAKLQEKMKEGDCLLCTGPGSFEITETTDPYHIAKLCQYGNGCTPQIGTCPLKLDTAAE